MLVREFFGKRPKPGTLGLELEVESLNPIDPFNSDVWLVKPDGSLRNIGSEFYTRNPIAADSKLFSRISELTTFLKNKKFAVDYDSTRTSFHVHVNVLEHTMMQMWTQVFAYWLVEPCLMEMCGESRCGNMYCLRTKDAEGMLLRLARILSGEHSARHFQQDNLRYASQNLKALADFGSIEYRGMRGSHDPNLLHEWAMGLAMMSESIKKFTDPADLFDKFDSMDRDDFINAVLPPTLARRVMNVRGYREQMSRQFDMLFNMVYDTDWSATQKYYESKADEWAKQTARDQAQQARMEQMLVQLEPVSTASTIGWNQVVGLARTR